MAEYDNSNSFVLFNNPKRETDKHPNMTGQGEVTCHACGEKTPLWLSGWIRLSEKVSGGKLISGKFKPKDEARSVSGGVEDFGNNTEAKPKATATTTKKQQEMDDEIPF